MTYAEFKALKSDLNWDFRNELITEEEYDEAWEQLVKEYEEGL